MVDSGKHHLVGVACFRATGKVIGVMVVMIVGKGRTAWILRNINMHREREHLNTVGKVSNPSG